MKEHPWWQRGVVYQIYPRSFKDSSGDGIGDLRGITQKLDYLSDTLGVDAIWLSPFYPSPMADFGYDVSNYVDVDPVFGDLAAFDELVTQAHRRDLGIIVDLIPNHTSDRHPWFLESRSSRADPKRDWYVWADAQAGGSPPNNWLSVFGGSAWEWDTTTDQYYLHSFLKEQPDLNWRNPDVRQAMLQVMRFWLERGVDGFRVDAAHLIMKDPDLRDNPLNPDQSSPRAYDRYLHLHDKGHADVHQAFRDMRAVLDEYSAERARMCVAEIHESDWPTWARYYGERLDEMHMPFNFALLRAPWTASAVREIVDAVEAAVPHEGWPNYVLGNHDEHRIASRVGPERARVAMMLLLTLRGMPTMYYGDEIGMHDVDIPPEAVVDPWEINVPGLGLGRDPERTPMQWDGGPNAGFCPSGVTPWLPVADDYRRHNVALEMQDPGSILTLTRKLLALRRQNEAVSVGDYQPLDHVPDDCFVYLRHRNGRRFLVALNFSDDNRTLDLREYNPGSIAVSTDLDREGMVDMGHLLLRGNEGLIVDLH